MITAGSNLSLGWHWLEALAEDDPSTLGEPCNPLCVCIEYSRPPLVETRESPRSSDKVLQVDNMLNDQL